MLNREMLDKEKLDKEKLDREKLDKKKLDKEKLDKEKLDKEKLDKEKLSKEILDREMLDKEKERRKQGNEETRKQGNYKKTLILLVKNGKQLLQGRPCALLRPLKSAHRQLSFNFATIPPLGQRLALPSLHKPIYSKKISMLLLIC